jgi:hydrogenase expression/formation protein HypD
MKYIDEFRDGKLAQAIGAAIAREVDPARQYNLMEFCGGHTHAIARYGLPDLLPGNVRLIHGPGCPVCVLPIGRIDHAIEIAAQPNVILCSFGDTLRVPASGQMSLLRKKALGADIRMVYSSLDAVRIAEQNRDKEVVFFAIGFETTTPTSAVALKKAEALGLRNFSIFCNHVLTPAALDAIMLSEGEGETDGATLVDGVIGPAHVSTIVGSKPYEAFTTRYHKPLVIAGFEPLDVLQSVRMLVRQLNQGRAEVENEYTRTVTPEGNRKAQALVEDVFEMRPTFEWRGLGQVPWSALQLRERYRFFDAEARFNITTLPVADAKACECGTILRGLKEPKDCKIFGTVCTPDNPVGACMVSSEGACAAFYSYGRFTIPILESTQ